MRLARVDSDRGRACVEADGTLDSKVHTRSQLSGHTLGGLSEV